MAGEIYFRTSITGYNKNDVIKFIERLNADQIERVNDLNDRLRSSQTEAKRLSAELEALNKKCNELEELLSQSDETRADNAEKARKYETMQDTYASIMLEAEHSSLEKVKAAEEKAEKIIAEATEMKKKVVEENKRIIEASKVDLIAIVDKLTLSLDQTLSGIDNE